MRRWVLGVGAAGAAVAIFLTWRGEIQESPAPDPVIHAPDPVVHRSRLPVLGTVGDLPPPEERLVIEADVKGRVFVEGKPVDTRTLRDLFRARADASRGKEGEGLAWVAVVLRVDRDLPWLATQCLMQACADPGVRVYRIFFAALPEAGGEEGAMATFLPGAVLSDLPFTRPPFSIPVEVRAGSPGELASPRDLHRNLRDLVERHRLDGDEEQVRLDASASVTTGWVLQAADVCLRSGVRSFVFQGPPGERVESIESAVAGLPRAEGVLAFSVSGDPVFSAPANSGTIPPKERDRTGYAGQFESPPYVRHESPHELRILQPVSLVGPQPLGMFSGRGAGQPLRAKEGGAGTEEAVRAGLDWLARHQSPSGAWDCDGFEAMCKETKCGGRGAIDYDPGVSGLALLAFLGTGETHKTPRHGPVVRAGLKYLKGIQDADGCFGSRIAWGKPHFGNLGPDHYVYNHAIAALAMVEAYGMTRSPLFKTSAQNGVNYVLRCQNPHRGWRYGVAPGDSDTSVTAWMVMALHAARESGLDVDPAAFAGAKKWLDKITEPESGRTGYTALDNGPARPQELMDKFPADKSEATTAMALWTRILCGAGRDDEFVGKGADLCVKSLPRHDTWAGTIDYCYWFFGSQALFQVGGDRWGTWNAAMKEAVLAGQRGGEPGDASGSWDPVDPWSEEGGRVYATAMNTLILETYFRYPRIGTAR